MKIQQIAVAIAVFASAFAVYLSMTQPQPVPPPATQASSPPTKRTAVDVEKWMVVESVPERTDQAAKEAEAVRLVVISPEGEILAIPDQYKQFFETIEEGQEVTDAPLSMPHWNRTGIVREDDELMKLWQTGYAHAVIFDEPHLFRGITFYVIR